jgi:glycosyltransferase involved in cell wall biosynthesis
MAHYPVKDGKITVTYEGVSEQYQKSNIKKQKVSRLLAKYRLKKPFFVYTGSAYPFKDLPTLLQALSQLQKDAPKPQLLIACARSVFWERLKQEISRLGLNQVVRLPGQVPDEDLNGLYQEAAAFVTPSLMEGFGLPGLEAMASGCPVIAARAGSLEEVYGQAAWYFPPQDDDALAGMMRRAIKMSQEDRRKLSKLGKKQAQTYSWDKTARRTLRVYEQVLTK